MKLDLDKTVESVEDRKAIVQKYIDLYEDKLSERDLEKMADYLIAATKIERRGDVMTPNRRVTVNKRETSMEGLTEKLEGGESAFHSLIKEDKNTILTPKLTITEEDLEEIQPLRQLREAIDELAEEIETMDRKRRYKAIKMLIEMRKDQYVIRAAYRKPMYAQSYRQGSTVYDLFGDTGYYDEDGEWIDVSNNRVDHWNPDHISELIENYAFIKEETYDDLNSDLRWMLVDLEDAIDEAFVGKEPLKQILISKIDKLSNKEIQKLLLERYGISHSQEYISALYRNKIPAIIVDYLKEQWVDFVYTEKLRGEYKTCTRCGEVKLAHNRYFSINRTSRSKFYSICKECRRGNNQ